MAGIPRATGAPAHKRTKGMRPPPRPSSSRAQFNMGRDRSGAISPAESTTSNSTTSAKRKDRDFENDGDGETNINVVVRCRGRNEREVRENSGVVVSTEGVKGKLLQLSMGPSALSNKTYNFDKVFSSAADQSIIYDDVVNPILDEMIAGFNCTIFAYGQTGTGKTYTMSGDMTEHYGMLSDAAGIIPRALHALFMKLELADTEASVKCSFIELYNEELRDLISADENVKLKIFDDNSKKGHSSTLVQGMEESHIKSAVDGIKLLQAGSHKRQVAATKCNDLSSRSHTVFTVTAYIKRQGDNGEDYVSAGKLNLVDLAGSENIQRSGAENKRAAEAGLINKSLLTLGRVINALVDKSPHIPYRESKLTRLLQDSLGGRTKTCIIATVSPAKSNLEETISTLDYAFRAKNIRNKPQVNQMVNKKTLLREFTTEIERLKGELIATRQRNGVYLSNEMYEEITVQSESRRILSEEQAGQIETMETNLRNKVQELFSITSNFMTLKKDNEATKAALDNTKGVLEQTEFVLNNTRQSLAEESYLCKAHQVTEEKLSAVGSELISTLEKTVQDVGGLHDKNRRKSDLFSLNRNTWGLSQAQVSEVTNLVEGRVEEFQTQQMELLATVSQRMQSFVAGELEKLSATQSFLATNVLAFENSEKTTFAQTESAKEEMDLVLEEIKTLREEVKGRVGDGLNGLSTAAKRISDEVLSELGAFHTQLHGSYSSLGRDFKTLFEGMLKHVDSQKTEIEQLRQELHIASEVALEANVAASKRLDEVLEEEREQAVSDRESLLSQIANLVTSQGKAQDQRLASKIGIVQTGILSSNELFQASRTAYNQKMDLWNVKEERLVEDVLRSREALKTKLKEDWLAANKHNGSIKIAIESVHDETIRIVNQQMKDIEVQMQALDDFVTRARSQNAQHHNSHASSLDSLSTTVKSSYSNIGTHFGSTYERVRELRDEMTASTTSLQASLRPLNSTLRQPLAQLRTAVTNTAIQEYQPTGGTPQKTQYLYPTALPRTDAHDVLLAALRRPLIASPSKSSSTTVIYNDAPASGEVLVLTPSTESERKPTGGLREININIAGSLSLENQPNASDAAPGAAKYELLPHVPSFKRSMSGNIPKSKMPVTASVIPLEGRENTAPLLSQSTGRRRSPRTLT
ncbi:P-loop containing nucleoside triphosphate hydrolase protein [Calycina marina]|uniref:P-loop containing nucleoside triphosphate hydrolase protein n=1 Tax=Calycina marina TaxID=1763456 RepID=A0A9P7YYM9_9HELO|nr:P-loop containing nucleoside triphosphate hydrolase protein [Calycina marina]